MKIKSKEDWQELIAKATSGDTDMMNEVAFWYRNGLTIERSEIIEKDDELAFQWTRKAYDLGNLSATEEYAHYLTDRENGVCEPDIEFGIELYKRCFEKGSKSAAYSLGLEYRNKRIFAKSFEYFSKSQGSTEFYQELTLALCYYYGVGVNKDKKKALDLLLLINQEFNSQYEIDEANYLIGMIYLDGEVVEQDLETARYYLELADRDNDHRSAEELLLIIGREKYRNENTSS